MPPDRFALAREQIAALLTDRERLEARYYVACALFADALMRARAARERGDLDGYGRIPRGELRVWGRRYRQAAEALVLAEREGDAL